MKNKIIIPAATAIGTGLIVSLVKRIRTVKQISQPIPVPKSHHRTDVFANAKKKANPIE